MSDPPVPSDRRGEAAGPGECPSEDELVQLIEGSLDGDALAALEEHIDVCEDCAEVVAGLGAAGAPPKPRQVGRYLLDRRIGGGGMGEVWAAWDPKLRREIAVKLVRPDRADDGRERERLLREARALARLTHPNVIAVHDVGETSSGEVFIATELVAGDTLASRGGASADWRGVVRLYAQAARGLAAAHAVGLVHRDVKPANLLVGADGRVRVADFGLAIRAHTPSPLAPTETPSLGGSSPVTEPGAVAGTPAYMAPEQRTGEGVDAPADQFALCVALGEAIAGRRPPIAVDRERLVAFVCERRPAEPELDALCGVLARGLAFDPAERHPDMTVLADELDALVPPVSVPARRDAPADPSGQAPRGIAAEPPGSTPSWDRPGDSAPSSDAPWSTGAHTTSTRATSISRLAAIALVAAAAGAVTVWYASSRRGADTASSAASAAATSQPAPAEAAPPRVPGAPGADLEAAQAAAPPDLTAPAADHAGSISPGTEPGPTPVDGAASRPTDGTSPGASHHAAGVDPPRTPADASPEGATLVVPTTPRTRAISATNLRGASGTTASRAATPAADAGPQNAPAAHAAHTATTGGTSGTAAAGTATSGTAAAGVASATTTTIEAIQRAVQRRDGKACRAGLDALTSPPPTDYRVASLRAVCEMVAGDCEGGTRLQRELYRRDGTPESSADIIADLYCPLTSDPAVRLRRLTAQLSMSSSFDCAYFLAPARAAAADATTERDRQVVGAMLSRIATCFSHRGACDTAREVLAEAQVFIPQLALNELNARCR